PRFILWRPERGQGKTGRLDRVPTRRIFPLGGRLALGNQGRSGPLCLARRSRRPRQMREPGRGQKPSRRATMTTVFRNFKTIVIQGSPAYEKSVLQQLNKLWDTWTGWAVLRGIIDTTRTVTIVPYSAADRKKMGSNNAFARATSSWAASPLPAFGPKGSDS